VEIYKFFVELFFSPNKKKALQFATTCTTNNAKKIKLNIFSKKLKLNLHALK
jgi:hypothetical protein